MGTPRTSDARHSISAGLTRLLARLDTDPDRAAAEYERLRVTLEKFFDWHGAWPPEECADETLDRLTLKLGVDTPINDIHAYARGIARLVLLEWKRRPVSVSIDCPFDRIAVSAPSPSDNGAEDVMLRCFDCCLAALTDNSRALVLDYYVDDRRAKIDNRRRLAQTLRLSEGALRNRVQRVRNRLELCVERCTASAAEIGLEAAVRKPCGTEGPEDDEH